MRKTAAIIIACALLTGTFASCGGSGSSSSGSTGTTAAADTTMVASEVTTAGTSVDPTAEEETEQDTEKSSGTETAPTETTAETTAEKLSTSEKTTAAETTEPETEFDPESLKGGNITGIWALQENDANGERFFNSDGTMDIVFDLGSTLAFKDGDLTINDEESVEYSFDGKICKAVYNEQDCIIMERISGETSPDSLDGRYRITGGYMHETLGDAELIIMDGKTLIASTTEYTYRTEGNKLILTLKQEGREDYSEESYYGIDGNELTIYDIYGEITVLKRVK